MSIRELEEVYQFLERHTSVERDSGSFCAEVAKAVADTTFPGPVVSDDDRKSWVGFVPMKSHPLCTANLDSILSSVASTSH